MWSSRFWHNTCWIFTLFNQEEQNQYLWVVSCVCLSPLFSLIKFHPQQDNIKYFKPFCLSWPSFPPAVCPLVELLFFPQIWTPPLLWFLHLPSTNKWPDNVIFYCWNHLSLQGTFSSYANLWPGQRHLKKNRTFSWTWVKLNYKDIYQVKHHCYGLLFGLVIWTNY